MICLTWPDTPAKGARRKVSTVRLDNGGKANGYSVDTYWPDQEIRGFRDIEPLPDGERWWYLMKSDQGEYCNERGSWQSSPGAEPVRDSELP
jgi:hypothetical protein